MKFGKLFPFGDKHFLHNVHMCTRTKEKYHEIIYGFGLFNLIFGCTNFVPLLCCKFVQLLNEIAIREYNLICSKKKTELISLNCFEQKK